MNHQSLLLSFVAARRRLAVPLEDIARIVPQPLLQAPVGAPPFLEGFFDLAGTAVAAVRLDRLLRLDEEALGLYSPLLVLKHQDPAIALHVTSASSVLKTAMGEIQPINPDETFNGCIVGRLSDQGETVYLLSTDEILLAEERTRIAALRQIKTDRAGAISDQAPEALAHAS